MKPGVRIGLLIGGILILLFFLCRPLVESFWEEEEKKESEEEKKESANEMEIVATPSSVDAPASPAKSYDTVTAPGILRKRGHQAPIEVPAPSGLPTFDSYIQTLVRSELASQGIPVTEAFQVEDVVKNTVKYMENGVKEITKDAESNKLRMPA